MRNPANRREKFGYIITDPSCGGTPGPQAPIANLFRISTPGIRPGINYTNDQQGSIYLNHSERLHRFESPNHMSSFWGIQNQEIQGMFQSGTPVPAYHTNNFGYVDHNFQAASQGNMFSFSGALHHLAPQNLPEQPGSGVKRYLEEQSPYQSHSNYLRPPLLESRVDSRQNILQSMSSTAFQNTPGSMTMSDKRRIMELQNASQEQIFLVNCNHRCLVRWELQVLLG